MRNKLWLNSWVSIAAIIIVLATFIISYKVSQFQRKEHEDYVEVELKAPEQVPTVGNHEVVQSKIDEATSNQLKRLSDSIYKLAKENSKLIHRLSILKQSIQIGPISIPYSDTNRIIDCDSFEKEFLLNNDTLSLSGKVYQDEVLLTSLRIDDALYTRDVVIKSGLFGLKSKTYVQILHTNPVFKTDSVAAFRVDTSPSWWHTTGKPLVGFGLGATVVFFLLNIKN